MSLQQELSAVAAALKKAAKSPHHEHVASSLLTLSLRLVSAGIAEPEVPLPAVNDDGVHIHNGPYAGSASVLGTSDAKLDDGAKARNVEAWTKVMTVAAKVARKALDITGNIDSSLKRWLSAAKHVGLLTDISFTVGLATAQYVKVQLADDTVVETELNDLDKRLDDEKQFLDQQGGALALLWSVIAHGSPSETQQRQDASLFQATKQAVQSLTRLLTQELNDCSKLALFARKYANFLSTSQAAKRVLVPLYRKMSPSESGVTIDEKTLAEKLHALAQATGLQEDEAQFVEQANAWLRAKKQAEAALPRLPQFNALLSADLKALLAAKGWNVDSPDWETNAEIADDLVSELELALTRTSRRSEILEARIEVEAAIRKNQVDERQLLLQHAQNKTAAMSHQ